jgi:hypothetical protein
MSRIWNATAARKQIAENLGGTVANIRPFDISRMSAIGPKPTSPVAPHMSAFGGKADISRREFDLEIRLEY